MDAQHVNKRPRIETEEDEVLYFLCPHCQKITKVEDDEYLISQEEFESTPQEVSDLPYTPREHAIAVEAEGKWWREEFCGRKSKSSEEDSTMQES